jgi:hypothetical protein
LGVRRLVFPDDTNTATDLEAVLVADATEAVSRIRTGLAFAAAHLWDDAPRRSAATDILVRLIPQADQRVSHGIMHVFLRTDVLTADNDTERLLRALHRHPTVLNGAYGSFFADRLQDVLSTYPDLVVDLGQDVIALWQPEGGARHGFAGTTAQFTNLALTFQRLDGSYRAKGLELFEQLREIGVHDAFATLQELDRRVPNHALAVRRPHVRRRARRK